MKDGWRPENYRFADRYTGRPLNHWNKNSPGFMVFDHPDPDGEAVVITSAWLNSMKADLDAKEFPLAMEELDRHFRGAPFRKEVIPFRHWYRAPKPDG